MKARRTIVTTGGRTCHAAMYYCSRQYQLAGLVMRHQATRNGMLSGELR
jgi:phosphoenolpyruvate synthase/pyruvate phosphate dikinase